MRTCASYIQLKQNEDTNLLYQKHNAKKQTAFTTFLGTQTQPESEPNYEEKDEGTEMPAAAAAPSIAEMALVVDGDGVLSSPSLSSFIPSDWLCVDSPDPIFNSTAYQKIKTRLNEERKREREKGRKREREKERMREREKERMREREKERKREREKERKRERKSEREKEI
jgi:flagellar biosynthesis GTPase FlhF